MARVDNDYLEKNTELVQTRVPVAVRFWLIHQAQKRGISVATLVRQTLMDAYRVDHEPKRFRCKDCWAEGTRVQLKAAGHKPEAVPKCGGS